MKDLEYFEEGREMIKDLYSNLEYMAKINPDLYIVPKELYNELMKKVSRMENRILKQTQSLKMHIKEKQELKRQLKAAQNTDNPGKSENSSANVARKT